MADKTRKRASHDARKPKADGKTKPKGPRDLGGDTGIGPGELLDRARTRRIARK